MTGIRVRSVIAKLESSQARKRIHHSGMRLIQEPGQLLTGRFSAITNDSASGSNIFENRIPLRPFNTRTLANKSAECSYVKGPGGDSIFENSADQHLSDQHSKY